MSNMSDIPVRLGILLLVGLCTWLVIWLGQHYVQGQRRSVLTASLPMALSAVPTTRGAGIQQNHIRILAFSSEDCRQCHQLQAPALQRVQATHGDAVAIVDIDATRETELAERYHVLTVPTTVVLDQTGRAHAVNYGFANTKKLLDQVDEVLTIQK
jgi:thioredoxin-related protein